MNDDAQQINVLLVEDDEDDYFLTQDLLQSIERMKFSFVWAQSYASAIEAIELNEFDIYFLDYRLGEKTGFDIARIIVEMGRTAPIILLTEIADPDLALAAMEAGVTDYLSKSQITSHILEQTIRYAIKQKKTEAQLRQSHDHLEELVVERTAELARQAELLEVALKQEKEHNNLQREFIAMISHEFRTPLAIIDGAVQRIARSKKSMTKDELIPRIAKVRNAVTRMTGLIESVLNTARLDAGKLEKKNEQINLEELVSAICQRQQEISLEHTITVDLSELVQPMWGDSKLLDQIFTNLLSNAVKYSPSDPRVEVIGKMDKGYLVVMIRDYGLGIPSAEIPKLFDRYFRASTSTGISGTGIGLNLVQELVKMHHGSIRVESDKGKGSLFEIRLPIQYSLRATEAERSDESVDVF